MTTELRQSRVHRVVSCRPAAEQIIVSTSSSPKIPLSFCHMQIEVRGVFVGSCVLSHTNTDQHSRACVSACVAVRVSDVCASLALRRFATGASPSRLHTTAGIVVVGRRCHRSRRARRPRKVKDTHANAGPSVCVYVCERVCSCVGIEIRMQHARIQRITLAHTRHDTTWHAMGRESSRIIIVAVVMIINRMRKAC